MRTNLYKPWVGLFAPTLALTMLAGCGTNNNNAATQPAEGGGTQATPGGGGQANQNQGNEGATLACPEDTPVILGMGNVNQGNVQNDNPFLLTSTGQQIGYNNVKFEPLAVVNRLDPTDIRPWLAESFEWNPDYTQIRVTPRAGVTWSDGTPFTADDIAKTFETMRDTTLEEARPLDPTGLIADVTVEGNQAVINFTAPRLTDWANVLTVRPMQKAYLETHSNEDMMTAPMLDAPQTGPYYVTSFTPQMVNMALRDGYWGGNGLNPGQPVATTINYVSFNDSTALNSAREAGTVTWAQSPLINPEGFLNSDPQHHVYWTPSDQGIEMMHMNVNHPPFDDPVFRRAANLVVNREAWREITFAGQGELLTSATGLILPAMDEFLNPALRDATVGLDVAKAQEMLREAGYQDVGVPGQLKYPDGTPVTFKLLAPSPWPDYVASGAMVVQSLRNDLGADVELDARDLSEFAEKRNLGDFDILQRAAGTTGVGPFWLYRDMISQPGMGMWAPIGQPTDWNSGRFVNQKVGDSFQVMMTSPDAAAREQALFDIQQVMVDESPVLLLGGRPIFNTFNTTCFVNWPSDENPYGTGQFITPPGSALMVLDSIERRTN